MVLMICLITAIALFLLGLYTCLTRVNAIAILMGIEIILNASALNFVAFSQRNGVTIDGHMMALFIIVLAAAEAVVALAILLAIYRRFKGIDTSLVATLKE